MLIFIGLFTLFPVVWVVLNSDSNTNKRRLTNKHTVGVIRKIEKEKNHLIYRVEFMDYKERMLVGRSLPYMPQSTCKEGEMVNIRYGMDDVGKVLVQIDEPGAVRKETGISVTAVLLYLLADAALIIFLTKKFPHIMNDVYLPLVFPIFFVAISSFVLAGILWQIPFTVLPKWKRAEGVIDSFISHKFTKKTEYYVRFTNEQGMEKTAKTIGYFDTEEGTIFSAGQQVNIRYAYCLFGNVAAVIDEPLCLNENDGMHLPSTMLVIAAFCVFMLILGLVIMQVIRF